MPRARRAPLGVLRLRIGLRMSVRGIADRFLRQSDAAHQVGSGLGEHRCGVGKSSHAKGGKRARSAVSVRRSLLSLSMRPPVAHLAAVVVALRGGADFARLLPPRGRGQAVRPFWVSPPYGLDPPDGFLAACYFSWATRVPFGSSGGRFKVAVSAL